MAIQQLLATNKLSAEFLSTHHANWEISSFLDFDQMADDLFLLFIKSNEEHIVHYIDDNVAVLYKPTTYEIVGIQIDNFESEFSKAYSSKDNEWKFANKGERRGASWVLSLYFDKSKKGLCVLLEKEDLLSNMQTIIDICYPTKIAFRQNRKPTKFSQYFSNKALKIPDISELFSKPLVPITLILAVVFAFVFLSSDTLFNPAGQFLSGAAGAGEDASNISINKIGVFIAAITLFLVLVLLIIEKIKEKKKK